MTANEMSRISVTMRKEMLLGLKDFSDNFDEDFVPYAEEYLTNELAKADNDLQRQQRLEMTLRTLRPTGVVNEVLYLLQLIGGREATLACVDCGPRSRWYNDAFLDIQGEKEIVFLSSRYLALMVYWLVKYGSTVKINHVPEGWLPDELLEGRFVVPEIQLGGYSSSTSRFWF